MHLDMNIPSSLSFIQCQEPLGYRSRSSVEPQHISGGFEGESRRNSAMDTENVAAEPGSTALCV
jgi:hypothetical protein